MELKNAKCPILAFCKLFSQLNMRIFRLGRVGCLFCLNTHSQCGELKWTLLLVLSMEITSIIVFSLQIKQLQRGLVLLTTFKYQIAQ